MRVAWLRAEPTMITLQETEILSKLESSIDGGTEGSVIQAAVQEAEHTTPFGREAELSLDSLDRSTEKPCLWRCSL